jgi:hypothetical protein
MYIWRKIMHNEYTYLVNEKAQVFIKLDNERNNIDFKKQLGNVKEAGINSIQIFIDSINDQNSINKINDISDLEIDNIVLNLSHINEDLISLLSEKIKCVSININNTDEDEKVIMINSFKKLNKNVGINIEDNGTENLIDLTQKIYSKYNPNYIVISPEYLVNDMTNLSLYKNLFTEYQKVIKELPIPIYMEVGIFHKSFIMDHPCNIYLCSGEKCHTSKGSKPRRLCIDINGDVIPEDFNFNRDYKLGNIKDGSIIEIINSNKNTEIDKKFIMLCRTLHEQVVIPSPSNVIPWTKLLSQWSNIRKH